MERIKSLRLHAIIYTLLATALVLSMLWAFSERRAAQAYAIDTENSYNRAFHEMTGCIDEIDSLLSKAQLANDPADMASMASEIFTRAAAAKSCLGQLPSNEIHLESTAKFLAQAGDYTYVLSQDMIKGQPVSEEAHKTLASLNDYASKLKTALLDIEAKIDAGELRLTGTETSRGMNEAEAASGNIIEDLKNVEKSFDEYPSLIYDGPFSEHIENMQSQMINAAAPVSREEAKRRAEDFLGIRDTEYVSESENTAIDCYVFRKEDMSSDTTIAVSKKGGYILYFLRDTAPSEERFDTEYAQSKAREFLESHGFPDMAPSYYDRNGTTATMNFASKQDGVVCYSDLIKVRVSLSTGEVTGMEAKGYLMNHRERDLSNVRLTEAEARARVSPMLNVRSGGLALIPKDSLREVLCYEYKGEFSGKNFIVYINAETGAEEEILLLIESENGILTV